MDFTKEEKRKIGTVFVVGMAGAIVFMMALVLSAAWASGALDEKPIRKEYFLVIIYKDGHPVKVALEELELTEEKSP